MNAALEAMMETIAEVAKRVLAACKFGGIYVLDTKVAGRFVQMGYRLLAMGSEHAVVKLGAQTLLAAVNQSIDAAKAG